MRLNIYNEISLPSVRNYNKIKKLTLPLKECFGIDRFWFNSHRNDGRYSLLGNYPPTAEIFFGQEYYLGHPFFRNPVFFCSGQLLPELLNNPEYEATQGRLKQEGDCFHVLLIIRKDHDGFFEYGFATSKYQLGFEAVYLNHLQLMHKFIDYFETEASYLLKELGEYSINIEKVIGDKYHEKPNIPGNILIPDQDLRFLTALEKEPSCTHGLLSLTQSERRCLKLYLSGATMKEVAKVLFISPRTVESHIHNSKSKLGIQTRSELFHALLPYQSML